jgi:hypothetical protein
MEGPDAHSSATIAHLTLLPLLVPDPLQCLAELSLTQRSWCPLLPQGAADPPDLKTAKGKGNQTQLDGCPVQLVHQPDWKNDYPKTSGANNIKFLSLSLGDSSKTAIVPPFFPRPSRRPLAS